MKGGMPVGIVNYVIKNYDRIASYTYQHLVLITIAIAASLLIWVSVGIAVRRHHKAAKTILGVGSFMMAVPSLSLYGILMTLPGFGLSRKSAITALVIYSLLPIVRNVYTSLNEVDPAILEAARGMGMPERKILFKVQLPLALPVIIAGIRVALVMMVGIATLAVYIGERNLGRLIHQGIMRSNGNMIITGAVLVSAISVGVDYLMELIKKKVISPGLLIEEAEEQSSLQEEGI